MSTGVIRGVLVYTELFVNGSADLEALRRSLLLQGKTENKTSSLGTQNATG